MTAHRTRRCICGRRVSAGRPRLPHATIDIKGVQDLCDVVRSTVLQWIHQQLIPAPVFLHRQARGIVALWWKAQLIQWAIQRKERIAGGLPLVETSDVRGTWDRLTVVAVSPDQRDTINALLDALDNPDVDDEYKEQIRELLGLESH